MTETYSEPPAGPLPARVAVVGSGIMGSGIAQVVAGAGIPVRLHDTSEQQLDRAMATIRQGLGRQVQAGRLGSADADAALARVSVHRDLGSAVGEADYVVEAVVEQLPVKHALFRDLDRLCPAGTILASNTSQFSITDIAAATGRPQQVVGMHFFNPPPVMRLVELVRGQRTSDETLDQARRFAAHLGKQTVLSADSQGFITSRLIAIVMLEAMRIVQEGVASAEDVDHASKLAFNWPMGPLELADFVGLDTLLYSSDALSDAFGDRFLAPQLLRRLVTAGSLGRKSGGEGIVAAMTTRSAEGNQATR